MIAKITYGSFTKGLINYHKKKEEKKTAEIFHSNISGFKNMSFSNMENLFNSYTLMSRRKNKNFHVSLNFTQSDYEKLSERDKKNLINDYLSGLGFPEEHPFIAFKHFDKKHPHIHIISPNIKSDGKTINDSNIFIRSRKLSRNLEKKYGISNAEHVKEKPEIKTFDFIGLRKEYENKKIDLKTYLKSTVTNYLKLYKPTNSEDLINGLKTFGIYTYLTRHKRTGLIYSTNFGNKELKAKDTGIKSSSLGDKFTLKALESTFEENKKEKKKLSNYISGKIDYIFHKYYKIRPERFKEELKKYDIQINYNYSGNKLSGYSVNYKGFHYKGQELPRREYTFGKIKEHFGTEDSYSKNYIISLLLYKNNLHKPKDLSFEKYLSNLEHLGILPMISPYGIKLSLKSRGEEQEGLPKFYVTDFNDRIKQLKPEEIDRLNEQILKSAYTEKVRQKLPVFPSFKVLSFFDKYFGDTGVDFQDEEEYNIEKRKKYLKRINQ